MLCGPWRVLGVALRNEFLSSDFFLLTAEFWHLDPEFFISGPLRPFALSPAPENSPLKNSIFFDIVLVRTIIKAPAPGTLHLWDIRNSHHRPRILAKVLAPSPGWLYFFPFWRSSCLERHC
jgi:hypothetical protein